MAQHQRRIDRVLEPDYLADLPSRPVEELRAMQRESDEIETEVSYVRRLAHARIDVLRAELDRRASGGSIAELLAALPAILARGDSGRSSGGRLPRLLAPSPHIKWQRGLERLVADDSLARLPDLTDDEIHTALAELGTLESEVSGLRRRLHAVIDAVHAEIVARHAAGRR